ncbi:MAG: tetratricopeptide repeat protein [Clostridia bacterium]|nr:tetratricopeptide repeat protein [Clostridia bacterium]
MAQLKVKTRGDGSPQGKQKVYFCCHPADFSAFFEPLSAEILEKQNCAIWYDDTLAPRDEEFLAQLQEMQLFVMPVTSRLLQTDNPVMETEFPFAITHHIPVLPLMQEDGLEAVFNEKCGDLQFLNKNDADPTAIPYDEKLKKYLSSVLVGDALAAKVRAAFDAYVFLSYRKKDRQHARELMRLIHKNDFCRDIAIWYDEFLTPGENFNDAIRDALEKSGLFVLAVTPNLVNEVNYIMTTEYPMAVERGKPVVPAEMVPTDKVALADKYADIPPCADAHDESALSAALLAAVQKLAIAENDHSPEHNFFIGLAYLNGIDVEVDHDRALALITGAAESGLVAAVKKLVNMYRSGTGVDRNYRTAIHWQEKLVAIREKAYAACIEAKKTDVLLSLEDLFSDDGDFSQAQLLHDLFWELIDSGKFYCELGRPGLAKKVYLKLLQYLENFDYDKTGDSMQYKFFLCYMNLGDACRDMEDIADAEAYYLQGQQIAKTNAEKGNERFLERMSLIHNRLGLCYARKGDWEKARYYHEKQLEQDEALAEKTGEPAERRNLAVSCINLGDVCEGEKKLEVAFTYYERSLHIRLQLAEELGEEIDLTNLAVTYSRLGRNSKKRKCYEQAKDYYQKALEIQEQMADKIGTVQSRQQLAVEYSNVGQLFRDMQDWPVAQQYKERALAIYLCLAEEVKTYEFREEMRVCCRSLRKLCARQGNLRSFRASYVEAIAVTERLAEKLGTTQIRWELSCAYIEMGTACRDDKDFAEAKVWFGKALQVREQLADESQSLEDQRSVLTCWLYLARNSEKMGDYATAKEQYLRYLAIVLSMQDKVDAGATEESYDANGDLYDAYRWLASVCEKLEEWEEAQQYRLEAESRRPLLKGLESLNALFDD